MKGNGMRIRWIARLLRDLALLAWVNRAPGFALAVLLFLVLSLLMVSIEITAPFVYTFF